MSRYDPDTRKWSPWEVKSPDPDLRTVEINSIEKITDQRRS